MMGERSLDVWYPEGPEGGQPGGCGGGGGSSSSIKGWVLEPTDLPFAPHNILPHQSLSPLPRSTPSVQISRYIEARAEISAPTSGGILRHQNGGPLPASASSGFPPGDGTEAAPL